MSLLTQREGLFFGMKNFFLVFLISSIITATPYTQETSTPQKTGEGAAQGTTSAATIAWAAVGVAFIVAIGIVIAVTISKDHNNQTVVISH